MISYTDAGKDTILVDSYTGNYQEAIRPAPLRPGMRVKAHESCDGREWDDIKRLVAKSGGALEYDETDGEYNVYLVVERSADDEEVR